MNLVDVALKDAGASLLTLYIIMFVDIILNEPKISLKVDYYWLKCKMVYLLGTIAAEVLKL
jgi:hypothetical protein